MYVLLSHQKNEKANLDQKKTSCSSLCIPPEYLEEAIFAGDISFGSFWGVEAAFGRVKGVAKTSTGYYGGNLRKPTHREVQNVSNVMTGHTEAVKVVYDKRIVSFTSLCEVFWDTHDPTDKEFLQFGVKTHLRSTIFYVNQEQRREALRSKVRRQMKLNRRIVTVILPSYTSEFFLAENCHQKYYLQKNHIWLCESLNLRSTEQFAASHAACKLNGLLGGECNDSNKKNKEELRRFIDGNEFSRNTTEILEGILQNWS
ncbi:uncharacterized protein LOC116264633 [Nymphaea colorata]|nr:uncharacterized protein LOC116264633 [Nymphaea colorata]